MGNTITKEIRELFFELIRISIGKQDDLSKEPTEQEWQELYRIAEQQALLGICFSGVRKMDTIKSLSSEIYELWLGICIMIQKRNELLDKRCADVINRIHEAGLNCCILKGQGNATMYGELGMFRQSGDIDVYIDGGFERVMTFANNIVPSHNFTFQHVHFPIFKDIEVEVHYTPIMLMGYVRNRRLQKWFKEQQNRCFTHVDERLQAPVPDAQFNAIYQLAHIYRHLFVEGIGLRQLLDYYYVLLSLPNDASKENLMLDISRFGMRKFAAAIMWILYSVFKLDSRHLLCEPDEKEGRFVLNEIMQMGNFGFYDQRYNNNQLFLGKVGVLVSLIQRKKNMLTHYPSEVISTPFYLMRHYIWKHMIHRKWLK